MLLSRDKLREKLVTILTNDIDNEVVFVTGHRGLGKTQLLSETLGLISDSNKYIVADGDSISVSTTSVLKKCFIDAIFQTEKVVDSVCFHDDLLGLIGEAGNNGDRSELINLLKRTALDDLKILYMLLSNNTPLLIVAGCVDLSEEDLEYVASLGNDSSNGKTTYILVARPNVSSKEIMKKVVKRRKKGVYILPLAPTIVKKADINEPTSLATIAINNEHLSLGDGLEQYILDDDLHDAYLEMSKEFRSGFSDDYFYLIANQEIANRNYINFVSVDDVLKRSGDRYAEKQCIHTDGKYIIFDSLKYYFALFVHRDDIIEATQTRYFDMIDQTSIPELMSDEAKQIALKKSITIGSLLRGNTVLGSNEISPGYAQYYSGLLRLVSYQMQNLRSGEGQWKEAIRRLRILDSTRIYCTPGMVEAFIDLFRTTQACYLLEYCLDIVETQCKYGICTDKHKYIDCMHHLFIHSLEAAYRWRDVKLMDKVITTYLCVYSSLPEVGRISFSRFRSDDSSEDADRYLIEVIRNHGKNVRDILMPKNSVYLYHTANSTEVVEKITEALDEQGYMLYCTPKNDEILDQLPVEDSVGYIVLTMSIRGAASQMKKYKSAHITNINGDAIYAMYSSVSTCNEGPRNMANGDDNEFQVAEASRQYERLITELQSALILIKESNELEKEQKELLNSIFTQIRDAAQNGNEESMNDGKNKFAIARSFLTKSAPKLVELLANMATVAGFLGVVIK